MPLKTDILIIGGGIGGAAIARELSRYELDVTLVEKEPDVGWGQTKASYAICHPGARWSPGTLAQEMIAKSNPIIEKLADELDLEFRRTGELILAFNREELAWLQTVKKQGEHIHVQGLEIIDRNEIRQLEPNANPAAIAALHLPTAGVFNPFELVFAFYENARDNGVRMQLNTEVLDISREGNRFLVETSQGGIHATYVINAAGLYAEKIAAMQGVNNFHVSYARKSACFVLDRRIGNIVNRIVTGVSDLQSYTAFKLVMPTYAGNILIYATFSEPAFGIDDRALEERSLDLTLRTVKSLVPGVDFERHIIAAFSGIAARNDRKDFIIEVSRAHHNFINVALPPPGITCSPMIGKKVAEILEKNGLTLSQKTDFNPYRNGIKSLRDASGTQMVELFGQDPKYGKVVCRCETVSEAEIIQAVERGAFTLDGVKFRTRAGMGRCQGNFCGPQVVRILARELDQSVKKITKKGPGSRYLA